MYNINNEKLNEIIGNASFSTDAEKNKRIRSAFLALFSELGDYSKSINDSILKRSLFQTNGGILSDISIALMDKEEGKKKGGSLGLAPMTEEDDRVFIDDEYENVNCLIGDAGERKIYEGYYSKDGQKYKFQYYFKFDRSYVERQELLYRYTSHYDILNPIIYSPYSYKAVKVVYDKAIRENNCEIDFQFHKNGINVIDGRDKELFWNIAIKNENRIYDAKIPYGEEIRYVFDFPKSKKGNYVLPLPLNSQTKIFETNFDENGIKIITNQDMDDFVGLEPLVLDELSGEIRTLKSEGMIFSNRNSYNGIANKRIVSMADIEHAIAMFRNNNGIKCRISQGEGDIVKRYSSKYRPNRNDRKLFNIISREYVSFKPEENSRFLTDYVNYVIEFLEFNYPEIEWVGEK